jgi:NIMA (never in mitosis gene a)-related kinase
MNSYQFVKNIGTGSYGNILLVKKENRYYAMKELNLNDMKNDKEKQMLINEIIIGFYHNCRYINKYDKILFKNNKIYLRMKYFKEGTLKNYLKKKSLTLYQKNNIVRQILLAVQYLHYNKVIHRDIKSDNILIDNGNISLADFGTCCILSEFEYFGKTAIGTPYYISPEIIEGKEYTYQTDIYSLGCLFCEIYKNKLPYNGNNLGGLYYNVMHSKKVINFNNSNIDNLIKKMISKNHIDRPFIQNVIHEFDIINKPLYQTKLFKKDKNFSKHIQKKYNIPKNWEYFILSFDNNNKLPNI